MSANIVVWLNEEHWAVWISLNIEKPHSESAFDAGIVNKPLN